ncbi:MAG: type II toxin-antitoxin system Phd/YefM family antitoxin [Treponema sp.]|jgi:prevent-host-death family protein|nr:type II toxin-antitoxin system Phd/YefM family antitoxin [Treponema sp.]
MQNTHVRPVRDLRNRYAEIEQLVENHDPVIITKNGRGAAVLINIDDYAEVEEYLHIKYVNDKLEEAELEAKKPGVKWTPYKKALKKLRDKYSGL